MRYTSGAFKLKDTELFVMPGNPHMLHLGTIEYGFREFICMVDRNTTKTYIEEVSLQTADNTGNVWCNLKFIEDDDLAFDLAMFCQDKGVTDMIAVANKLHAQGKQEWIPSQKSKNPIL